MAAVVAMVTSSWVFIGSNQAAYFARLVFLVMMMMTVKIMMVMIARMIVMMMVMTSVDQQLSRWPSGRLARLTSRGPLYISPHSLCHRVILSHRGPSTLEYIDLYITTIYTIVLHIYSNCISPPDQYRPLCISPHSLCHMDPICAYITQSHSHTVTKTPLSHTHTVSLFLLRTGRGRRKFSGWGRE